MQKPLIGITAYDYFKPENGWRYDVCYGRNATAIEDAGGLPVLIPSHVSLEVLRAIYERLDAVLLPGGGDINPAHYHDEPQAELLQVSDVRDQMELNLTRWAVVDDRPVFGICRGIQVMNVALGGTIMQDIPSSIKTDLRHDTNIAQEPRSKLSHDVAINGDSHLARILGQTRLTVNSLHHQSLNDVAPGMTVTAQAPDGIIEGIEMPGKHFIVAVQWHPEDLTDDAYNKRLFEAFVEAARERMRVSN